ncbi:MlaE family ABC transporter permease [Hahella ganghwensis]|uniref:MlaE family ABC transporter permease n=1 Tax=Hahella ganghwensis TaxID=286420 RepID=UPI00035DC093|nr:ABC transporter permease [Hahella ganghwensis]
MSEQVNLTVNNNLLLVQLSGDWSIHQPAVDRGPITRVLDESVQIKKIVVDGQSLGKWDSALVSFLFQLTNLARKKSLILDHQSLPEGAVRMLSLATAVPKSTGSSRKHTHWSFVDRIGLRVVWIFREFLRFVDFLGESLFACHRFVLGKAVYRREDLLFFLQDAGPSSLGIVTLISVLIGMILAFVGAVQLEKFGASIYVANLVGLSMAREMAAMMTAIIMAGRTGAAYAAQLGSMQVNEEVDALKTMGISPMEFLVAPRMAALVLMMPLLTIYANLMGILGGGLVSVTMLDLSWSIYFQQISHSVPLVHFTIGLVKSVIFGVLVALSGCYMGMNSGRSATAVGAATTSAVVMGIVLIIVFDSLVTILTTVLDI